MVDHGAVVLGPFSEKAHAYAAERARATAAWSSGSSTGVTEVGPGHASLSRRLARSSPAP